MIDQNASSIVEFDIPLEQPDQPSVSIPHLVFIKQTKTEPILEVATPSLLNQKTNLIVTFIGVIMLLVQLVQIEDFNRVIKPLFRLHDPDQFVYVWHVTLLDGGALCTPC